MIGDSAIKLAKEAKRTADAPISPYNDKLVEDICREIRLLHNEAKQIVNNMKASGDLTQEHDVTAQIMLRHLTIKRNKRVLFAYHKQRVSKLKDIVWNAGLQSRYKSEIRHNIGENDKKFIKDYSQIVEKYKHAYLDIDLGGPGGASLEPPVDLFIQVRVMKDAGEITTEFGTLNLVKGNQYYVKRTEVESLIRAGYLAHITDKN
ncbi:hypothetical protein BDF20DRAFT_895316 [Mycotypha africana]|uniref:uncharacterized protein n=1 Tax=Mycotypha africana TaxID=64632 RepID=UPI0023015412|nr:uncharacterized protein BDF20DRAFT_895316 [Mycotypha africana]KAI8968270.1 hypothetical protein BDF20DRAFT_895316 [Mycotypha africana]